MVADCKAMHFFLYGGNKWKAFLLDKIEISPPSLAMARVLCLSSLPYQTMEYLRLHALKQDERQIFAPFTAVQKN